MPNEDKRASWLELFYDIAFIALVAQLTYLASEHHHSIADLLNIFIIGYTIFIAWWATTANRNLQPTETATDKFLTQIQMVGVFLMSITMAPVFEGEYIGFFLTLAFVRLLQSFMIVRMYYFHPDSRPVTYNILEGFFAASALWALSAFLPDPYHFIVALMALGTDILVPLTRGEGNTKRYLNVRHLQERLGLFLMLVIGESMIVVALSNSASGELANQTGVVFSGLALMIALWWLYFEHSDIHAGKRPRELFAFLHSHGFLFGSIILVSVGYKLILEEGETPAALYFLVLGMVGIAITLISIRSSLHPVCIRAGSLVVILGLLGIGVSVMGYLTGQVILTAILLTSIFAVAAVLDYYKVFSPKQSDSQDC